MYCGRKKYSPSSTHASSIITRVFQISWFPKFNQKNNSNPDTKSAKTKHRDKQPHFPTPSSPLPTLQKEPRFYTQDEDDDDAYWRLSFREQRNEDRKSTITGITHLSSDSDDKFQIPVSSFTSFGSREMKEKQYRTNKQNGEEKLTTPRKKDRRSRIMSRRQPSDRELKSSKPVEKDIFPVVTENKVQMKGGFQDSAVSENQQNISFRNSSLSSVEEEDYAFGRVSVSEWQDLNLDRINDKTGFRRKSHCRRIKEKIRANNYSPKREFKVRVLEEMKKEKMRSKRKETKERVAEGGTIYDSFAEVKTSFNPQQDFRDSMVEMICEKGIQQPEELEDLLACYLTLNCDEYHDLIIKVFQQVWFELSSGVY